MRLCLAFCLSSLCILSGIVQADFTEGDKICSGTPGVFNLRVGSVQKGFRELKFSCPKSEPGFGTEMRMNIILLQPNGSYKIVAQEVFAPGKEFAVSVAKGEFKNSPQLIMHAADAPATDWIFGPGVNSVRCYPKESIDKASVPKDLELKKSLNMVITFGDDEKVGACGGAVVSKKRQGETKLCKYKVLTAAHCLRQFLKDSNKQVIATSIYFDDRILPEVNEVEVETHPKYRRDSKSRLDIGIATFEAECKPDSEVPVWEVNDALPAQNEACVVLGKEAGHHHVATIDRSGHPNHNVGIDWSMHDKKNASHSAPSDGWSGSPIIIGGQIRGCFWGSPEENPPYGVCASGECLAWVRETLQKKKQ